jgi:hypothetical protein
VSRGNPTQGSAIDTDLAPDLHFVDDEIKDAFSIFLNVVRVDPITPAEAAPIGFLRASIGPVVPTKHVNVSS